MSQLRSHFPSACFLCIPKATMKQDKGIPKKRGRGRPAGRHFGEVVPVRLSTETCAKLERWAERQSVSRSEAIRRVLERGLKGLKGLF